MSKSESRRAAIVRSIRLTAEEAAAVDSAAAARGIGPSSFAREALLRAAKLPAPKAAKQRDLLAAELAPVLGALGRIGNNLNQALRIANTSDRPADVRTIEQARQVLAQLHRTIVEKGQPS